MRFKEFNTAWIHSKIGEICEIEMCKRIFSNQTNTIGGVPFYKIGTIGGKPDTWISQNLFNEYKDKYNYPKKGEILITCSGTVGKCIIFNGEDAYFQDSNIVWLANKSTVLNIFLFYIMNNIDWSYLNSTTITRIYGSDLRNLDFYYPNNKNEQQKVTEFLSLIDKRIDTQSKIIEDLELFKKGIENQYFSCNKNNEYVILGDVITQINNRNEKNIDFEVLSVSNKYGFIPQSEQFDDHEVASANKSNYKIVKQNDFAYNPARINVGSIAMLRNNQVGIVSPMYICFRANNNRILSSYLDYFSHSNKFNNEVLKNLEGSVRLCLSFESLSKIKIHLPSLDTQYEIVKNLDLISNKISIENKILEKLKEQKKYLLSNMFI